MYLKNKDELNINTDINSEFNKIKKKHIIITSLVLSLVLILIIITILVIKNNNKSKTSFFIDLKGEIEITIYKDTDFIDPGYKGYDNKGNDLTDKIIIENNIDTSKVGDYKITYTLNEISKTRYIKVVNKPIGATSFFLKGDTIIYLKINSEYKEPGYVVIDSIDSSLNDKVKITSNINTKKAGIYTITYTVTNSSGVTTQASRTIIVVDNDISLIYTPTGYTNKNVEIKIYAMDNYFEYLILPDGTKIKEKNYTYKVDKNGKYSFTIYNKFGGYKKKDIEIKNIDKEKPTGTCTGTYNSKQTKIKIDAKDNVKIKKYCINHLCYQTNNIVINKILKNVDVTIYDLADNTQSIKCNIKKIDDTPPTGSCKGYYKDGKSYINIDALDDSGINKYIIDDKTYTTNSIILNKEIKKINIDIYDNNGNINKINCILEDKNDKVFIPIRNKESKPKYKNITVNSFTPKIGPSFAYWLYEPDKIYENMPLIAYINGIEAIGNDYKYNTNTAITLGPINEIINHNKKYNAIIVHLQVPVDSSAQSMTRIFIEGLNKISNDYKINKNKISIMGFSHGCYGVMSIVNEYPNYFATAIPIGCCFGAGSRDINNFKFTKIWSFAGSGDGSTGCGGNDGIKLDEFTNKINAIGGNAKYTRIYNKGHGQVLDNNYSILRDEQYNLMNWILAQSK